MPLDTPQVSRFGLGHLSGAVQGLAGDAVREAAPTHKGDPDGREYDEGVEDEVDTLTCPHCGGKVPRG